ncbi:hypothetical protein P8452_56816 [Trifolium repens]|nr:hypothetical protein P8452_56816 [Trifolium repens]
MPTSAEKSTRTNNASKRLGRFTRTKMDSRNFWKKKVSGCFPEHGAIFMSNRNTLKECFERSLFGLPDNFSSFVKNVKAGMILFLFQFEDRKLYGVFKAISDGGMNIVPRAYASSGKQFPAQVKFTPILRCDSLFENEFSDNQNDSNGKDLSRAKHEYQYGEREEITQQSDGTMHKRASVFQRLTGDDVAPQIHFMAGLNEGTSG